MAEMDLSGRAASAADENTLIPAEDMGQRTQLTIPAIVRRRSHLVLAAANSRHSAYADHVCRDDAAGDLANAVEDLPACGGLIEMAGGTYDWRRQVTVSKDNTVIHGHGNTTRIRPVSAFPAGAFALQFYRDDSRPLAHCQVKNLSIHGGGVEYTYAIHGLDFCCYRGLLEDVFICRLSGDGLRTRSTPGWNNYESRLHRLQIGGCGNYGINANSADQHWSDLVVHANVAANVYGALTGCMIANSHFYGGTQNAAGTQTVRNLHLMCSSRTGFVGCKVEHAAEELLWLDGETKGGSVWFNGCRFRNGGGAAENTYAQVKISRGGGNFWLVNLDGCRFDADVSKPAWNIQILGDAMRNSRINGTLFESGVSGKVTPFGEVIGRRSTINNLGFNSTDPNTGGDWKDHGDPGLDVRAGDTGVIWKAVSETEWVALT